MIFGSQITLVTIMYVGFVTMALLVFQILVGMRKIKFKGRTHMKVHKWGAWALFGIGIVHGLLAMTFYYGWRILS